MRVWRGDEDGGALQDYSVDVNEGEVVLDIIHRLQQTQAVTSPCGGTARRARRTCSAEINGRPRLLCMTRMSTFTGRDHHRQPLRTSVNPRPGHRRVVRLRKARESIVHTAEGSAAGRDRMAQEDVDRSQETRKCIECFLCQNTCHVVRDHRGNKKASPGRDT